MEVSAAELIDFRNYRQERAEFAPGLNLVVGQNGQGKTNLLEAVHLLSAMGSHRSSSVAPLVRWGAERAVVRASATSRGRAVRVDAEIVAGSGVRMLVNKVPLERSKDAAEVMATVLFSPDDLALIKGGPEERRRFLDHAAARARPLAAADRAEFERVLRQRNGVLKAGLVNPRALRSLEVWDEQFIRSATAVVAARLGALSRIAGEAGDGYRRLAASGVEVNLQYQCSWAEAPPAAGELEAAVRHSVEATRARDVERGTTHTGPHRDDLELTVGGADARTFASQGEQRSLALSLRLAELRLVTEVRQEQPVLLLDDVFSELDDSRRVQLAELVVASGQTIITTTSPGGVPLAAARTLTVDAGKILAHA